MKSYFRNWNIRRILPESVHIIIISSYCNYYTRHSWLCDRAIINEGHHNHWRQCEPVKHQNSGAKISQTEFCASLAELLTLHERFLFCHTLLECAEIYSKLKRHLGQSITEPPGLPNIIDEYGKNEVVSSIAFIIKVYDTSNKSLSMLWPVCQVF